MTINVNSLLIIKTSRILYIIFILFVHLLTTYQTHPSSQSKTETKRKHYKITHNKITDHSCHTSSTEVTNEKTKTPFHIKIFQNKEYEKTVYYSYPKIV